MSLTYEPVEKHWFYKAKDDKWVPFSYKDSAAIQQSYENNSPAIISTDLGRYDVNVKEKTRIPIYWKGEKNEIRRCSWFYKVFNKKYQPYDEEVSEVLEREYKNAVINNKWSSQLKLSNDEIILIQSPNQMYHFLNVQDVSQYFWHGIIPSRIVIRGLNKFKIAGGDDRKIDHLIFVVPGIASGAVLRYRSDVEVIAKLRNNGCQLIKSHYKNAYDQSLVGQIEVLPVSWQDQIHSPNTQIDEKLKTITLESLPKFRNMANNTVLDVLSYTSPYYCQNIINTVGNLINENYRKFCERNPDFDGVIAMVGHSLGGLIIFDLLSNQKSTIQSSNVKRVHLAGTGQTIINYPQLLFVPTMCFTLGTPLGLFVALRDVEILGLDFKFPTCSGFYNIFHPFDPIAYRMEGLINPELGDKQPVVIPHHKASKRTLSEIKETMTRVKNDIKEKVYITYKNIFEKMASSTKNEKERNEEINKEVEEILQLEISEENSNEDSSLTNTTQEQDSVLDSVKLGQLNKSKRIDYVLQAGPLETINEYLFALNSHVGYWESEDTMLFIVKELYLSLGISPDV